LSDDVEAAESRQSEQQVFRRDIAWLTSCDVLIAEASGSSYGVGFEVGYVLGRAAQSGQRVVLLYDANRAGAISRLIVGNCDVACTTLGYASIQHLTEFIERTFPRTAQMLR
jgi:nucleoside 2-deoxyribosyltransferase